MRLLSLLGLLIGIIGKYTSVFEWSLRCWKWCWLQWPPMVKTCQPVSQNFWKNASKWVKNSSIIQRTFSLQIHPTSAEYAGETPIYIKCSLRLEFHFLPTCQLSLFKVQGVGYYSKVCLDMQKSLIFAAMCFLKCGQILSDVPNPSRLVASPPQSCLSSTVQLAIRSIPCTRCAPTRTIKKVWITSSVCLVSNFYTNFRLPQVCNLHQNGSHWRDGMQNILRWTSARNQQSVRIRDAMLVNYKKFNAIRRGHTFLIPNQSITTS